MRSIRVYLTALVAVALGFALASGMVASTAGAKPGIAKQAKQICKKKKGKAKKKCIRTQTKRLKKKANKSKLKLAPKITSKAPYTARGSVGDAYVEGAAPGTRLLLVNAKNRILRTGVADSFGSKIFYDVPAGATFTVRTPIGKKKARGTSKFKVLKPGQNPKQSFYDSKTLQPGLNYVTMRDGVELAMTVRLPSGKTMADGPFPTFIEHSGYQAAAPHDLLNSFLTGDTSDPLVPAASTVVGALLGQLLDFATVSVQMRGSGCSGGAFDLFGWPTTYDGYDAVETVAAQDWVAGGTVGMGGISFSGVTQLFAAGTRPPHLAAIAPLSITEDVYSGTGFPGGIFNDGFALTWITERAEDALPAPDGGQPWARTIATTGDPDVAEPLRSEQKQQCLDNQKLRLQTRDFNKEIENNPYRTPLLFEKRAANGWVKNIDVPVFWVGAFQDEQTSSHWVEALRGLPKKNPNVWITMQNGVHADSLGPKTITRMAEFMNLFIGDGRIPKLSALVLSAGATLYDEIASAGALPIEQSRFAAMEDTPANVAAARTQFKQDPRVRILMDNGNAIDGDPGAIGAVWETGFDSWPISSTKPSALYLGEGGALSSSKASSGSSVSYVSDPSARPSKSFPPGTPGDPSWQGQPPYDWKPVVDGKGLGFVTPALAEDTFIAGPSSADLYLKSTKSNTDVQVTLTEVRPDGKETYVQNGWLRATHRAIDKKASTAYNPVQTFLKKDSAPLKKGKYNLARVQIFPVAHVFRAGSKIRLNIQAPGGDRTIWNLQTIENGTTTNTIGLGGAFPSKLVLPVIPGQTAQGTDLPPPTALRGQPSREYAPAGNGG